ncbi:hypothetical protein QJS10_CPB17g01920 [Acorus calamus]|uniref:Peptidase A1 domain-containing protein n=1 Tax=Acorus calamus TaxID=4465 RepID=A0AAV9CV17_ACOCL|nr:hypothetical protein QJS10_CPB17g01920 [Acorus calamus]
MEYYFSATVLFLLLHLLLSSPTTIFYTQTPTLLSPITKEPNTLQYTLTIHTINDSPTPVILLLDLGFAFTWLANCNTHHPLRHVPCNTPLCASLHSITCMNNNTCGLFAENPVTRTATPGPAVIDSIILRTTDGRNVGPLFTVVDFVLSCAGPSLLKGLAEGVVGLAGLGSTSNYGTTTFALCLSGSPSAPGVAFFNSVGPYIFQPNDIDLSTSLNYVPLLVNPVGGSTVITYHNRPSDEYYVKLTSIRVNGKPVPLDPSLLQLTKLSTTTPYTTMESSIYKAFVQSFVAESSATMNLTAIESVRPFKACYDEDDVDATRVGWAVPTVDFVMGDVFWRVFGGNSMVRAGDGKLCLAFVDGGRDAREGMVIGGFQMEDNMLEFDLGRGRLGFSSTLLLKGTTCSNFNFTTVGV